MPKKTQSYGTTLVKPEKVYFVQHYVPSGTSGPLHVAARAPFTRRFGRQSTITSQSGKDGAFRPVVHSQANYLAIPLTKLPQYTIWTGPQYGVKTEYIYGLAQDAHANRYSNFTAAVANVNTSLATVQWDSLSATALQSMLPSFHTQNSLVNFLLELKDFKSVVKYMRGNIQKKLSAIENALRKLKQPDNIRRSNKPLDKLARAYLSYSFGWKPLYNDLVSFVRTVSGFEARYRELVQRANAPQQSYWGTWVAGTAAGENLFYNNGTGDPPPSWVGPTRCRCRVRVIQEATNGIRYHATIRYRYAIPPELSSAGGKAKAFLDTLGVAANPAVIWNAIPFSFLIDYLVDIGNYLERLRVDNIPFKTEILDFCHSARIERRVVMEVALENEHYLTGKIPFAFLPTDMCKVVMYERKLGLPNYLTAMQTSGLNYREFSLVGALAVARRKG
jgi:hypothetical protein